MDSSPARQRSGVYGLKTDTNSYSWP